MTNLKQEQPKSLQEAIDIIVKGLTQSEIEFIKTHDASSVHHYAGMKMRNDWSLWDLKTPLVKDIQTRFGLFGHGDDCSGLIHAGIWATVRGQNVEKALKEEAEYYTQHWIRSGLDPKTGKEIKGFKKGNFNMVVVQKGKRPKII